MPGLRGAGLDPGGLAAGIAAGAFYAVYLLLSKSLRRSGLEATGIVFVIAVITALVLLPWGLAESTAADFTTTNVLMAAVLGVVTTALTFSLFIDGMHFIKVQHASIMGYIEPVSAPLYAFVLLGQRPSGVDARRRRPDRRRRRRRRRPRQGRGGAVRMMAARR